MGLLRVVYVRLLAVRAGDRSVLAYHEGWAAVGLVGSNLDLFAEHPSTIYQYLCLGFR